SRSSDGASGHGAGGSGLAASRSKVGAGGWGLAGARVTPSRDRSATPIFALFAVFAFLVSISAQQSDRARTEALARRATERLQALQREADRLAAEERSLLNDVKKLEIERQIRAEQLKRVDADAAQVQAELDATVKRADSLEQASRDETPQLRARLV